MAQTNDGLIYGLDELVFGTKTFGFISEEGLQAGGDAPSTTQIRAAQKGNSVVKNLITTPGSKQFTFTLIQLKGENFVDVFGGTVDTKGIYSAPAKEEIKEGVAKIKCASGHTIVIPKASLSGNLAQALNLSQTLAVSCTMDILTPDGLEAPFKIYPPGETPA